MSCHPVIPTDSSKGLFFYRPSAAELRQSWHSHLSRTCHKELGTLAARPVNTPAAANGLPGCRNIDHVEQHIKNLCNPRRSLPAREGEAAGRLRRSKSWRQFMFGRWDMASYWWGGEVIETTSVLMQEQKPLHTPSAESSVSNLVLIVPPSLSRLVLLLHNKSVLRLVMLYLSGPQL